MTIEQLDKLNQARPFRPFTLHLTGGSKHGIVSPEFLARSQAGRTISVSSGTDAHVVFD